MANRFDRLMNRAIWTLGGPKRALQTDTALVSFTFDDVPDSARSPGADILEHYGARGTFYIAGGLAGTVEADRSIITPPDCRDLAERGHELGCHTFSHRKVRSFSGAEFARDLDRNADYLAGLGLAAPPRNFAFPYNSAWPPARSEFRSRFRSCRGAGESVNRGMVDPLMLKSVAIGPEAEARALTRWIDDVVADPGWLIFFGHDVAANPTPYGCTPQTFDHLVRYAAERGCAILPVDRALDRIGW
ncbi:polysaccharide deacetylase family protein [Rhodopseudomonas rhenobacensis]